MVFQFLLPPLRPPVCTAWHYSYGWTLEFCFSFRILSIHHRLGMDHGFLYSACVRVCLLSGLPAVTGRLLTNSSCSTDVFLLVPEGVGSSQFSLIWFKKKHTLCRYVFHFVEVASPVNSLWLNIRYILYFGKGIIRDEVCKSTSSYFRENLPCFIPPCSMLAAVSC